MKFLILLFFLLLPSCASRPVPSTSVLETKPLPEHVSGSLRRPDVVRAYHVGRYVDPNYPGILHEHHPVYRVEVSSRWNLRSDPSGTESLANTSSYTDAAYSPPPSNDLITAELKRQKDATETVMWEATQLAKSYDELQKVIKDMAAVAKGNSFLSAALGQTDQRVARIEKQLGQILLGPASETNATPGLQIEEPDVPR